MLVSPKQRRLGWYLQFARRSSPLLSLLSLRRWIEINYRRMGVRGLKRNTSRWVLRSPTSPLLFLCNFASPALSSSLCLLLSPLSRRSGRAVIGLDKEADVVHIETRVAKGRECRTPVKKKKSVNGANARSLGSRKRG